MIIYREASTLAQDLGVSVRALYVVSNSLPEHYRTVFLPKRDGTDRRLSVPDRELMAIQRSILRNLLARMPVSPHATAYRYGGSAKCNARVHVGKPMLLRLDIRHFFDSILYSDVKDCAFPARIYAEPLRILLAMLCYHGDSLPQGAPTSPAISNLLLYGFDRRIGGWCWERGICYTRYCDDMAFSGDFDPWEVRALVGRELRERGLFLNEEKTRVCRPGQRQSVTGLIVNDRLNVPRDYRRGLRQELYFCRRFGAQAHLERLGSGEDPIACLRRLLGQVSYVLQITPHDSEMSGYRDWLQKELAAVQSEGG